MTSTRSTLPSSRRRLAAAVVAVALLALGGGLWWRAQPVLDWADRDSFCDEAKVFVVANQESLTVADRVGALRKMVDTAQDDMRDEMRMLLNSMDEQSGQHAHYSPDELADATQEAGEFIELACGLNLPSIRT